MKAGALSNLLCYYTENDVSTIVRGRRYDYILSDAVVRRYSSKLCVKTL